SQFFFTEQGKRVLTVKPLEERIPDKQEAKGTLLFDQGALEIAQAPRVIRVLVPLLQSICTFLAQLCTSQEHRTKFMSGPTWRPEVGNEANSPDRGGQQQQSKDVATDERPSPALRSQEEPR